MLQSAPLENAYDLGQMRRIVNKSNCYGHESESFGYFGAKRNSIALANGIPFCFVLSRQVQQ